MFLEKSFFIPINIYVSLYNWDITSKRQNIDHKGLEVSATDVYKLE